MARSLPYCLLTKVGCKRDQDPSVAKDRTMKTAFSSASFLAVVVALTGVASAQVYGIPGAGYPYSNNYHHASTVEQGILDGIAAATAAQGQANYFNSLAEINHQDARSRYINNNKNAVDGYFYVHEA